MGTASKLILCVEDDFDTQEMLGVLIRQRGYNFKATGSCAEALRMAQQEEVALILLDSLLTDGNGIDLCRQIRHLNMQTPIIFISGTAHREERDEALQAGANAFLTKPFELNDLFAVLDAYAPLP